VTICGAPIYGGARYAQPDGQRSQTRQHGNV